MNCCNNKGYQCLSPLKLYEFELRSWWGVLDTTLCDKVCQWLETGRWFSPGTSVSSSNKTDRHDITEILFNVALHTKALALTLNSHHRETSLCQVLWWLFRVRARALVCSATLNNISVISWRSVLLLEETEVPGENYRPVASHWQTLSHNVESSTPRIG
jgi:hypothetical protein